MAHSGSANIREIAVDPDRDAGLSGQGFQGVREGKRRNIDRITPRILGRGRGLRGGVNARKRTSDHRQGHAQA